MGCDMVVALPPATGSCQSLFGVNVHRPVTEELAVRLMRGQTFEIGEMLRTRFLELPQARRTFTVLGIQARGSWGELLGVNECRVAMSCSDWQSRCRCVRPGLLGPELVRLTLERAHSARHALEVLTDLIVRHGQGSFSSSPEAETGDQIFLVADATEAFAIEAAGSAWAAQEIHEVRAAGDVGVIRQDWCRLAPGLADRAIAEGWWPADGSKLDFAGAVCESLPGKASALRRWGRATLLLEQQRGHLDCTCVRRILADHYDGTRYEVDPQRGTASVTPLCQHAMHGAEHATAASAVAQLPVDANASPVIWIALGPPCITVHFPLLLDADLPRVFGGDGCELWSRTQQLLKHLGKVRDRWTRVRESLGRLQTRFEQELEEYLEEAASLKNRGLHEQQRRLAGSMMQSHAERFEETAQTFLGQKAPGALASAAIGGIADF
jgi:secernin